MRIRLYSRNTNHEVALLLQGVLSLRHGIAGRHCSLKVRLYLDEVTLTNAESVTSGRQTTYTAYDYIDTLRERAEGVSVVCTALYLPAHVADGIFQLSCLCGHLVHLLLQFPALSRVLFLIAHVTVLYGEQGYLLHKLPQLCLDVLIGDGIVARVALELAHVCGQVLQMRVKVPNLFAKLLAHVAFLLLIVEALVCPLQHFKLQGQLLVASFARLHLLLLIVEDKVQVLNGCLVLALLGYEFCTDCRRSLCIDNTRLLLIVKFLLCILDLFEVHLQRGKTLYVLLARSEKALGYVESTLVLHKGFTLRLVLLLYLCQLPADGVRGLAYDVTLLVY